MPGGAALSASVYEGESRAIPRWTVVVLCLLATVGLTWMLLFDSPGSRTRTDAPFFLQWPSQVRSLAVGMALFVAFALVQFGRRRALGWGIAGLVVVSWLGESQAAFTGYQERHLFACGAVFAGWVFGVAFSQALARELGQPGDPRRDDAFGEAGAAGVFVANYLGACTSKLLASGFGWADAASLLSTLVGRHTFSGGFFDSLLTFLLAHPSLAHLLALTTLAIQAGSVLYLVGPRLRMLWGTLIIGFHVGAFVLMGVKYFFSILIAVAFSYPWPRLLRRVRGLPWAPPEGDPPLTEGERAALPRVVIRAAGWIAVAGCLALASWLTIHADDSTRLFLEPARGSMDSGQLPGGQEGGRPPGPAGRR